MAHFCAVHRGIRCILLPKLSTQQWLANHQTIFEVRFVDYAENTVTIVYAIRVGGKALA